MYWPPDAALAGHLHQPVFASVQRIAVLRGGGLGDLIFVLPAVEALRAAYPRAEVVLLGTPVAAALFDGRPSPFDRIEQLPVHPGVRDGADDDPERTEAFLQERRAEVYDLAVQVHGGGRNSNPFLLRLGARHTVGTGTPDAVPLERTLPYRYYQHEVLRALEVAALAGAAPTQMEPVLRLSSVERAIRPTGRRVVAIHPGATDPRRRWPAIAYAEVAAVLAREGIDVVLIGDASDLATADAIVRHAADRGIAPGQGSVRSVAGQIALADLVGLLRGVDVLLANDSGPRHLAQAAGVPTVGIFWFGNAINAAPLSRGRHRLQLSFTTHCPDCGRDVTMVGWTAERCEHDPSLVAEVSVGAVLDDVRDLLAPVRR